MKVAGNNEMGKTRGAFTLVELLTIVVLLGVIAAVVLPHAGYSDREKALMAARKVAADIEYAQGEAVNRQASVAVTFSPSGESYSLSLASAGTLLINPLSGNDFNVNLPGDLQASGVDLNSANFGDCGATLTFNAYGEPVQADGTPISSDSGVIIRCGDSLYTVGIAPVTGRVTVVSGS